MLEGILVCHYPKKNPVVDCKIEKEANLSHTTSPRPPRSFRLVGPLWIVLLLTVAVIIYFLCLRGYWTPDFKLQTASVWEAFLPPFFLDICLQIKL